MQHPDVIIAGAGIIGLSLALELASSGARVTLLDQSSAIGEASVAAAGMLAADDPFNPPALRDLAHLSVSLYPAWLRHIASLSGIEVPFQTHTTFQLTDSPSPSPVATPDLDLLLHGHNLDGTHVLQLQEHSIDPRQLAPALLDAAIRHSSITLLTHTRVLGAVPSGPEDILVFTPDSRLQAADFIDCTGAWSATPGIPVFPRKGQMLALAIPPSHPLSVTVRSEHIYVVPRLSGPNAGRAVIGATVEDAGFDKSVHSVDLARLREHAEQLLPFLSGAPVLDRWAGLRPATPDQLPLLGTLPGSPRHHIATGHFRNGILLAPATAHVMAHLLLGRPSPVDLRPFHPARFAHSPSTIS